MSKRGRCISSHNHLVINEIRARAELGICRCHKTWQLSFAFSERLKDIEALMGGCMINRHNCLAIG